MKHCLFVPKGSFHLPALFIPSFHPPQNHMHSGLKNAFTSPDEQRPGWVYTTGDSGTALGMQGCALTSLQKRGLGFTHSVLNPNPKASLLLFMFLSFYTRLLVISAFVPIRSTLTSSLPHSSKHLPQVLGKLKTSWKGSPRPQQHLLLSASLQFCSSPSLL